MREGIPFISCLFLLLHTGLKALKLKCKLSSLYMDLGGPSSRGLFGSLNLDKVEMRITLVELLSQDLFPLRKDYERVKVDLEKATLVVKHFAQHPNLHPFVLPFTIYMRNRNVQVALKPWIKSYSPGSLEINSKQIYEIPCKALKTLLKGAGKRLNIWSLGAIEAARLCHRTVNIPWEISNGFDNEEQLERMIETRGEILSLLDSLYRCGSKSRAELFPNRMNNPRIWGPFEKNLIAFERASNDWKDSFALMIEHVIEATQNLDEERKALWHAKLIACLLDVTRKERSFPMSHQDMKPFMIQFLNSHQVKDIPPFIIPDLMRYPYYIDIVDNLQLIMKLDALEEMTPFGSTLWWSSWKVLCKRWLRELRYYGHWKFLAPNCDPCTFSDLKGWWADYNHNSISKVLFLNPRDFEPLKLKRRSGKVVSCSGIESFLAEFSQMLILESGILLGSKGELSITNEEPQSIVTVKAFARTLLCNLLYRKTLGFSFAWPMVAQQLYGGKCTGVALMVSQIISDAKVSSLPIAVFSPVLYHPSKNQKLISWGINIIKTFLVLIATLVV